MSFPPVLFNVKINEIAQIWEKEGGPPLFHIFDGSYSEATLIVSSLWTNHKEIAFISPTHDCTLFCGRFPTGELGQQTGHPNVTKPAFYSLWKIVLIIFLPQRINSHYAPWCQPPSDQTRTTWGRWTPTFCSQTDHLIFSVSAYILILI